MVASSPGLSVGANPAYSPGGQPGFDGGGSLPVLLGDLEIWLDSADTGTVLRDGSDKVSRWNDKSGNGNDATQGTGANQPTFNSTGLNNKPTLCFDFPTSDFMLVPNGANGSSEYDVFVVAEVNNTVDTMHMLSARPLIDNVDTFTFNRPSTNNLRCLFNATANNATYTDLTTTVGAPFIAETAFGSTVTDMAGFKDGILSSFTDTASGVMNVTPLGVGCLYNTVAMTPQDLWDGNISEILVYSRSLTTSERATINQYLSNKWGIAVTAPTNIEDLELWLDAADSSTILEEDTVGLVSKWLDKSGNSFDSTQSIGSRQPTTNASTQNGHNITDYDGGDLLVMPSGVFPIPGGPTTSFVVAKTSLDTTFQRIFAMTDGTADMFSVAFSSISQRINYHHSSTGLTVTVDGIDKSEMLIITATRSGTALTLSVNGTSNNNANGSDVVVDRAFISSDSSAPSSPLTGSIGEVIIYDRLLSASEISANEAYLSNKWGITIP